MTRAVKPVDDLIRFVVGPDGVVPDLKRKLPGRGLWVTADRTTLTDAIARKVFARGFKRDVRVTPDLVDLTERLLVRAALDALAIAGKAGLVATGFAKVEAALARDEVVGLLHAADAGAGRRRQARRARCRQRPDGDQVAGRHGFHVGPIGFGIGPVKCGTCSPACRACKRHVFGAFARLERFRTGETGRRRPRPRTRTDRIRERNGRDQDP